MKVNKLSKVLLIMLFILIVLIISNDTILDFLLEDRMFSLYGSMVGVLGSYSLFRFQLKKEREKEVLDKLPLLFLNNIKSKIKNLLPGQDLVQNGMFLNDSEVFSELTLPLINAGKTAITKVDYNYEVKNLDHINSIISQEAREDISFYLSNKNDIFDFDKFSFTHKNQNHSIAHIAENFPSHKYIPVVMPGETVDLQVTSFISLLWNYMLLPYPIKIKPEIELEISYIDFQNKKNFILFKIELFEVQKKYNDETTDIIFEIHTEKIDK